MPSCVWANGSLMRGKGGSRKADGYHVILRLFGCQGWMMDGKSQGNTGRLMGQRRVEVVDGKQTISRLDFKGG